MVCLGNVFALLGWGFGWALDCGVWLDCVYGFGGLVFVLGLLAGCLFSSGMMQFALFECFVGFDCVCVLIVLPGEFVV